ncbi:MAG: DNA topoisomerase [Clostridia bacterium]|nr:DNA topoisomerase [Clostridia bacterium]
MAKKLLITEKPSVAREFAKALKVNTKDGNGFIESDDYVITWCVGHLVTMSYPEVYDENLKRWTLDTLPFMPKQYLYEVIPSASKQYDIVTSLMKRDDVDTIYVCTDSGREGEYIYRLVDQMCGSPDKIKKRVWIDSQTEEAIFNGIRDAKDLSYYDNLSDAAYLRAKEDYLIGINFSRILTLKYSYQVAERLKEERSAISVGRVMTCVLGMVVQREREIKNFKKVSFYKIVGKAGNEGKDIPCEWKVKEGSSEFESPKLYNETGFKDRKVAEDFISELKAHNDKFVVSSVTKKTLKENPSLLFNLAELQSECTKRFKISPDETLNIAQSLYEKKLTTYPRTDARVLSTAVCKVIGKNLNGILKGYKDDDAKKFLDRMAQEKYSTKIEKSKYVNDSKITDHYAIIPTGEGYENIEKLTDLEKKVYKMIVLRFIAIFYPPAEYNRVGVELTLGNETFVSSGKVCVKEGYLEVIRADKDAKSIKEDEEKSQNDEDGDEDSKVSNLDLLKDLKKGMELNLEELGIKEGETSPPTRYTSGSIILAMENAGKLIEDEKLREQIKGSGIGTSATRAEIIKKLNRINYIKTNSKTQILTSTDRGEVIYDIVKASMPDTLNPELTASWEKGLSMVADGELKADEFMTKLEDYISKKVDKFKNAKRRPQLLSSAQYQ